MKQRKVLAVASAGGHWKQLARMRPAFSECLVVYVSTSAQDFQAGDRLYIVPDANRQNLIPFVSQIFQLLRILLREKPDAIVTTGAAPGLVAIFLGRSMGIRGAWIDSFANVDKLSLSGALAKRVATLHLVQWPHLASKDSFYLGSII